jgi:hypothetical protein
MEKENKHLQIVNGRSNLMLQKRTLYIFSEQIIFYFFLYFFYNCFNMFIKYWFEVICKNLKNMVKIVKAES